MKSSTLALIGAIVMSWMENPCNAAISGYSMPTTTTAQKRATTGNIVNIADFGAIEGNASYAVWNLNCINNAFNSLQPYDSLLIDSGVWYTLGGINTTFNGNSHTTMILNGELNFVFDLDNWAQTNTSYVNAIIVRHVTGFTITSTAEGGGVINGNGKHWWDAVMTGEVSSHSRPSIIRGDFLENILIERVHIINNPRWAIRVKSVGMEVRYVHVEVDRRYVEGVKRAMSQKRWDALVDKSGMSEEQLKGIMTLQPEDLNTDGIDPTGQNIYVHDCVIQNDDDSVAVKPAEKGEIGFNGTTYDCTENVLIENMVLTGFGASIGSVSPSRNHHCIRNVVFRNISMPGTGKGIYIKSDKGDCASGDTGEITNILYENVTITNAKWWPIWIGPQQQNEPHQRLGGKCALFYPIVDICPTEGCVTFDNITLRNIAIEDSIWSPGVLLGNETNPMSNVVFENVIASSTTGDVSTWPFDGYHVENTIGTCIGTCDPFPEGFDQA